jgi:hypothetical protein
MSVSGGANRTLAIALRALGLASCDTHASASAEPIRPAANAIGQIP